MKLLKPTLEMDAHFYLDYMGHKSTRDELVAENREGWAIVMFYLGGGFCPLKVAVGTVSQNRNPMAVDVSSAADALYEWLERERPDELDEDDEGYPTLPEEMFWQVVPAEVKE